MIELEKLAQYIENMGEEFPENFYDTGHIGADFGKAVSLALGFIAEATGTAPSEWHLWTIAERFDPGYLLAFERPAGADTKEGEPALALVAITNDDGFVAYPNSVRLMATYTAWDTKTGCTIVW